MFLQSLIFVIETVADIFAMALLLRFLMQWARVPFRNPIGQFVIAATDWVVRPVRKLIPGLFGVDLATLLLAWLVQVLFLGVLLTLSGVPFSHEAMVAGSIVSVAAIETLRLMLHLLFGIVIVSAVLSWVNPYAPLAPLFNALALPFLAPFRRFIPPIGGLDLSPVVLILVIQLLLGLLDSARATLMPLIY